MQNLQPDQEHSEKLLFFPDGLRHWVAWFHGGTETHQQVSNKQDYHEEGHTHTIIWDHHAVPHTLNPLSTQQSENKDETVEKVIHVPTRKLAVSRNATDVIFVVPVEHLHASHREHKDCDEQNQSQVPHWSPDDLQKHVEHWPPAGQSNHSQLEKEKDKWKQREIDK